ncbi:unnamed protein product [Parnassius apollo]|uniref:(apollo) hypothetical protein n=1 Tax=Parnassius apollo TaxID=110799 RepID=A0A8S3X5G6_PARAO|nr:unnamed protein product [Parnassius apollo]
MILVRCGLGATRCEIAAAVAAGLEPRTEIVTVSVPARALTAAADLFIIAIYIPPDSGRIPGDIECLLQTLTSTISTNGLQGHLLVIGDFNMPCISWHRDGPVHTSGCNVDVRDTGNRLTEELRRIEFSRVKTI